MIKAIVFDFDGVILESASIKTDAFAEVVKEYPKSQAEAFVAYHRSHMGISRHIKFRYFIEEILKQSYTDEAEQRLANRFEEIVFARVMGCPFVAGAREFLERNCHKYDLYVASGTPQEELEKIVEGRELGGFFKDIYGTPMKKEEIVEHICGKAGYQRDEMCFVGDALTDKKAAENTGLLFVGRNTEDNEEDFQDVVHRVDSLLELEMILEGM